MTPPGGYVDDSIGRPLPGHRVPPRRRRRAPHPRPVRRRPATTTPSRTTRGARRGGLVPHRRPRLASTRPATSGSPAGRRRSTRTGRGRRSPRSASRTCSATSRRSRRRSSSAITASTTRCSSGRTTTSPARAEAPPDELRELLSSLVASANRFLAPFERVVAFQVLPRALDEAHGELTHKATFKREVVEKNWKDLIEQMYEQKALAFPVDGMYLRIPNWVLREMGVLQHEVALADGTLRAARPHARRSALDAVAPGALRARRHGVRRATARSSTSARCSRARRSGSATRRCARSSTRRRSSPSSRGAARAASDLRLDPRMWPPPTPSRLAGAARGRRAAGRDATTRSTPRASSCAPSGPRRGAPSRTCSAASPRGQSDHAALCRALLRRARRRARRGGPAARLPGAPARTRSRGETLATLRRFLDRSGALALRDEDLAALGERGLADPQVKVLLAALAVRRANCARRTPRAGALLVGAMRLVTAHAHVAPRRTRARRASRSRASRCTRTTRSPPAPARSSTGSAAGSRTGSGPNLRLAIDPDTGAEYGWKDVLVFDAERPGGGAHTLLLQAIADTTMVRASVFLFGRGVLLSLADIPPGRRDGVALSARSTARACTGCRSTRARASSSTSRSTSRRT